MALQVEEYSETQATKETLIDTKYNGKNSEIRGKEGEAYLRLADNQWMFRPNGTKSDNWFRVDGKNLSCNEENGWIRCQYTGANSLFGLSKTGKAYFDEEVNSWIFKPKGSKDEFRVGELSLQFIRDKDVI